jgi:putative membrane protein
MNVMTALTWATRLSSSVDPWCSRTEHLWLGCRSNPGHAWEAPLVIVLLAFFVWRQPSSARLSLVGVIFRQRREISRLKRELRRKRAEPCSSPAIMHERTF